jgi:hypothetical protein
VRVQVSDQQLRSWRAQGYSLERIAVACNTSISQISRRIHQIWSDQQRQAALSIDPDAAEISAACERIQREWSAKERQRRQVGRGRRWTPAVVPDSVLALARD